MRPRGKPFEKGNAGRRPGSRNRATLMSTILTDDDKNELIQTGIQLAKQGDRQMVRFFLERLIPREQPVKIALPQIRDHQDVANANEQIIRAVSAGEILPSAAAALTSMIANINKTLSDAEVERSLLQEEAMIDRINEGVNRYDSIRPKTKVRSGA